MHPSSDEPNIQPRAAGPAERVGEAAAIVAKTRATARKPRRRPRPLEPHGWLEPVQLPGVPITDPRWAEARRGRRPPNFGRTFPAEPLSVDDVVALIDACPKTTPTGLRNRALIVTAWRSGLRISELLDLRPKDIDLRSGAVRVVCGKGAQSGVSFLDPAAVRILQAWLRQRAQIGIPADRPLFCTVLDDRHIHGELYRPLRAPYVRNLLKRLARKAGIERRVHPHGFRHTMADEFANEEISSYVLQAQLRHKHLSSTEAYRQRLGAPELRKRVASREWPAEASELLSA